MTFKELIEQTTAEASADPLYVGSREHRVALEQHLAQWVPDDVTVEWLEPGQRSYWEQANRIVAIETPSLDGVDSPDAAVLAATLVLHEALHVTYSTDVGDFFRSRLSQFGSGRRQHVLWLFNELEDARVGALAAREDQTLVPFLEGFHRAAAARTLPPKPSSKREQFNQGLMERVHFGGSERHLSSDVVDALGRAEPYVASALTGSTADAGESALALAQIYLDSSLNG